MRSVSPHREGAATLQAASTPRAAPAPAPMSGAPTPHKMLPQLPQSSEAGVPAGPHQAGVQAEADAAAGADGSRFQGLRVRSEEVAPPGAALQLAQLTAPALLPQQPSSAPVGVPPAPYSQAPALQPPPPAAAAAAAAGASPGSPHLASASLPPPMISKLLPRMPPPGFPASPPPAAPILAAAPASPATRPAPYQPLAAAAAAKPLLQAPTQLPLEAAQLRVPAQLPAEAAQPPLPQQFQQLPLQAGSAVVGQATAAAAAASISGTASDAAQAAAEGPAAELGEDAAESAASSFALLQRLAGTGEVDLSLIPSFVCPLTKQPFVDPGTAHV